MKNRNLFYTLLLALPLFVLADNDPNIQVEVEDTEEEVVAEQEVSTEESSSSGSIFVSDGDVEEVVVTGSRLKRSTFDSIAPLQIISGDVSREVGLIDPADILQDSTMATGQQIDQTFQGLVLDNGPGASTLSLRGLGTGRTLLLMNGRRIGPGGVEGAPTAPDLNLLPGSLIERYDVLLDGASSVYGSDAVGGVTNVILRTDFDGWEAEIYAKKNKHQPGSVDDRTFNVTYGVNSDRWFLGFGAEVSINPEVKLRDRPWTADCETDYEITTDGEIRTINYEVVVENNFQPMDCKFLGFAGQVVTPGLQNFGFGPTFLTYADGYTAAGFNNWMMEELGNVYPDFDGDGTPDSNYAQININGKDTFSSLSSDLDTEAFMAFGEYNLEGEGNHTVFFELNYGRRQTYSIAGGYQLFPWVPADNPYNLCNVDGENGQDCYAAIDAVHSDPAYVAQYLEDGIGSTLFAGRRDTDMAAFGLPGTTWGQYYANFISGTGVLPNIHEYYCGSLDAQGNPVSPFQQIYLQYNVNPLYANPFYLYGPECFPSAYGASGSIDVNPIVSVKGDRTETRTDVDQLRFVIGMKGDLLIDGLDLDDWTYEVSAYQTSTTGKSFRGGVRDDKLALALGYDPSYDINTSSSSIRSKTLSAPCAVDDIADSSAVEADVLVGCVPVNMFAPSLYNGIIGSFETQAEKDYLWYESVFNTTFDQQVMSAYATGTIGEAQGGAIGAVVGFELREDEIISTPDTIRDKGLFFGFAANGGAKGKQFVKEGFVEVAIPVLAGMKYAQELNIETSARYSEIETENYFTGGKQSSTGSTYSFKVGYRPINDLLIRGTIGTSYRAPNLREVALRAESGFSSVSDPCRVPASYIGPEGYDPTKEQREEIVLENCRLAGVDPTTLGYDFVAGEPISTSSTEVKSAGVTTLDAEESMSVTYGFVYDLPIGHTVGASWYDITVDNAIIEPSAGFIVYDCYYEKAGLTSRFCNDIVRDSSGEFDYINTLFLNRDEETARGIDINYRATTSIEIGDRLYDMGMDITANKMIERTLTFTNAGQRDTEDYTGEPGYPEWTAFIRNYVSWGDWNATWQVSYKSRVDQDPDALDDWSDVYGAVNADGIAVSSDTCYGIANNDVDCRDVGFIKSFVTHNMSLYYRADTYSVGFGVRNVFDKEPPKVDGTEISSYSNVPIGYGYSLFGREYFLNISKAF
jgi:iron complex outermembrane receptor protein